MGRGKKNRRRQPMTRHSAMQFPMPFGKFKGKRMAEIACEPDGRSYLGWLLRQEGVHGSLRSAAEVVLTVWNVDEELRRQDEAVAVREKASRLYAARDEVKSMLDDGRSVIAIAEAFDETPETIKRFVVLHLCRFDGTPCPWNLN